MNAVNTNKIQIKIKNLEFEFKINSNYLDKNPENKEKIKSQISSLKALIQK